MEKKKLILIAGLPGSGKSTVSRILANNYKLPVVSMGDCVREEAKKEGVKEELKSMKEFMIELRKKYGKDFVAKLTSRKIERMKEKVIVVDGIRSKEELEFFKNRYEKVFLLVIHSDINTRFKRLAKRRRPDDPKSLEELKMRDEAELSLGLREIMKEDIRIINEGSIKELEDLVNEIIIKNKILEDP